MPRISEKFNKVILVDTSEINNIPEGISIDEIIEVIDHRKNNHAESFKNAKIQIELVGSAATLVAEKFKQANITPSENSAAFLLMAIISNTLNFQSKTTTERDKEIAHWLKTHIALPANFVHQMFAAKSDLSGSRLQQNLEDDAASFDLGGKKVSILQLEIIDAERLVKERKTEILEEIERQNKVFKLDLIFLTIIDLEKNFNLFVTRNNLTQKALEAILQVKFTDNVAKRPGLIMRKEIVPLIKNYLENV